MVSESIIRLNLAKGLIQEGVSPQKISHFLTSCPELITIYEQEPLIHMVKSSWLFYILNQTKHTKKWLKELKNVFEPEYWNIQNEKGNTVFIEAVKKQHLNAALFIAKLGADINIVNNEGKNFIDVLEENIRQKTNKNLHKKKWISILLFSNKILENEYPCLLSPDHMGSFERLLKYIKSELEKNKKESQFGYPQYWDDAIQFNSTLLLQIEERTQKIRYDKLNHELNIKNINSKKTKI